MPRRRRRRGEHRHLHLRHRDDDQITAAGKELPFYLRTPTATSTSRSTTSPRRSPARPPRTSMYGRCPPTSTRGLRPDRVHRRGRGRFWQQYPHASRPLSYNDTFEDTFARNWLIIDTPRAPTRASASRSPAPYCDVRVHVRLPGTTTTLRTPRLPSVRQAWSRNGALARVAIASPASPVPRPRSPSRPTTSSRVRNISFSSRPTRLA